MPLHLKSAFRMVNKVGLSFFKKIHTLLFKPKSNGEPMDKTQVIDKPETPEPKASEPVNRDLSDTVCEQVLAKLGKPPKFHKCTACHIPKTRNYRVNVWNKGHMSSGIITDSFFVTVNDEGLVTNPSIERRYTDG